MSQGEIDGGDFAGKNGKMRKFRRGMQTCDIVGYLVMAPGFAASFGPLRIFSPRVREPSGFAVSRSRLAI
jgi:hypothetical protein